MDIFLGLLCGMTTSFFSMPSSAPADLALEIEAVRFPLRLLVGFGCPIEETRRLSLGLCASEILASLAFVPLTIGAFFVFGFSTGAWAFPPCFAASSATTPNALDASIEVLLSLRLSESSADPAET
jgi:hypothetical protein